MSDDRTIYTATAEERALAVDWHGGQASVLYAIASTGALALGGMTHEPMSDAEWRLHLASRLHAEIGEIIDDHALSDPAADYHVAIGWLEKIGALVEELAAAAEV